MRRRGNGIDMTDVIDTPDDPDEKSDRSMDERSDPSGPSAERSTPDGSSGERPNPNGSVTDSSVCEGSSVGDSLPTGLVLARTTEVFDAGTVPAGLRRAHRVADGVWGRLVVHAGTVNFVFEDAADEPVLVAAGASIVIPPGRAHHVEPDDSARFVVEFYRPSAPDPIA